MRMNRSMALELMLPLVKASFNDIEERAQEHPTDWKSYRATAETTATIVVDAIRARARHAHKWTAEHDYKEHSTDDALLIAAAAQIDDATSKTSSILSSAVEEWMVQDIGHDSTTPQGRIDLCIHAIAFLFAEVERLMRVRDDEERRSPSSTASDAAAEGSRADRPIGGDTPEPENGRGLQSGDATNEDRNSAVEPIREAGADDGASCPRPVSD